MLEEGFMNLIYRSRIYLIIIGLFFSSNQMQSQDYYHDNMVYVDYIKTVQFTLAGLQTSLPIVDLGSRGRLQLSFDDLEGGYKRYTYHLVHCDMNWYPTPDFAEIEYLEGFNGQDIEDYSYSTNGYSDYTNYRLLLPNDDLQWIVSGNYLLVIYVDDLEIPVITRRFVVAENRISIMYDVIKPRNVEKLNTHHELKLSVSYKNFRISQPRQELFATVIQNGNWYRGVYTLSGIFERGQSLIFDQYDNISFSALKEFRKFDIRPLNYRTEFVHKIEQNDIETRVILDTEKKRVYRNFLGEIDANGFFVIDNERYNDSEVSSEYCRVFYSLVSEYEHDRDLYIVGSFSDWQAKDEFKLEYDPLDGVYKGSAYFKQGYYDYLFALLNEDGSLDYESIEGSWYESENDYQIIIYYSEFGSFYDRVLAVRNINSNNQF